MASSQEQTSDTYKPSLPFPISRIGSSSSIQYTLYDIDLISWLRREHHILGVLIGSLPQAPSQNVFLGLPLELMPEEVCLLVEKGLAFIADEREWQLQLIQSGAQREKIDIYQANLKQCGLQMAEAAHKAKEIKLEEIMKQLNLEGKVQKKTKTPPKSLVQAESDSLFSTEDEPATVTVESSVGQNEQTKLQPYAITPTTAGSLASLVSTDKLPKVDPSSYALFKMLHDQGYFLSPGLRFGCQYMAYPGDPLRYHSHFLTIASDWNTGIDLMDIIGSGRLATGVKKSFLLGGVESGEDEKSRAFSIEWAGF